jgi:chemotaxis protein CheD
MRERLVRVAGWAVDAGDAVLVTLGLGSCVAVALYDPVVHAGGLAHLLLPSPELSRERTNPARFPQTAVPLLLAELAALGADRRRLTARLVGGASMFSGTRGAPGPIGMGERNVVAAREVLAAAQLPVVGEAVQGSYGRSVYFFLEDGRLEVRTVARGTIVL